MTRAIKRISRDAYVRWGMTGTPPEEPDRFWSVWNFVTPENFPSKGRFIERFVNTEINPWSGFPESKDWKIEKTAELSKIWDPFFLRRTKEVVHGGFTDPQVTVLESEMTPKQAKAYKDLKTMLIAELDNGLFYAQTPGVKMQRLRQLASAYGELTVEEMDDGSEKLGILLSEPSGKLDTLEELLEELGPGPVVVFAEQKQLIELAYTRLGEERSVRITGGQSDKQRDAAREAFQRGDVDIVLCTTAAGGEGISLNRADTTIYLQRPWDLVANKQTLDRMYMEGRPSFVFDIRTPNTVDADVYTTLEAKGEKFETLMRDEELLRRWLK